MPYQVADRGRQCPPTLPIEYAREVNSSNNANTTTLLTSTTDLHQGQQTTGMAVAIACEGVDSTVCTHDNRATLRIEEAQESIEKSHRSEQVSVGVKRPFPGHTTYNTSTTGAAGDHSSAPPSLRNKKRSWHRRPRGGPYRPRGNTYDHANSTTSSGGNANATTKATEPMDQENSSTTQHKRHRHRLHKPYAAPPCNTTQVS